MGDLFVGRFGVKDGPDGRLFIIRFDIAPVVLAIAWIVVGRILCIAAMAGLYAVKIQPGLLFEPEGGRGAAAGMEGDEMGSVFSL